MQYKPYHCTPHKKHDGPSPGILIACSQGLRGKWLPVDTNRVIDSYFSSSSLWFQTPQQQQHLSISCLLRRLSTYLTTNLTITTATVCLPGRAGIPAPPLTISKTATSRFAGSQEMSLETQAKRNGFLSDFRTWCRDMVRLFGLPSGIPLVSFEIVRCLSLPHFSEACDIESEAGSRYMRASNRKPRRRRRYTLET